MGAMLAQGRSMDSHEVADVVAQDRPTDAGREGELFLVRASAHPLVGDARRIDAAGAKRGNEGATGGVLVNIKPQQGSGASPLPLPLVVESIVLGGFGVE